MSTPHDAYAALRHRDYRLLLSAGMLTTIGLEVQAVAVGWELFQRTNSAWYLGLTGLVQFLPVLVLALPAGQAADRYSRKLLFQLALATFALTSVGLTLLSVYEGPIGLILGCLFVSGVARSFSAPARTSLLPQLVPLEVLPNAVTWNASGWQFANVFGPALGGGLLYVVPPAATYAFAAVTAFASVWLLLPIRPQERPRAPVDRSLASLLAGVRFVLRTDLLLAAITLDLFAVLLGGATALLPLYAEQILEVGSLGFGVLRAAPAVGALLMAVTLAHLPPLKRPGIAMLLSVLGFGVATIVFGLSTSFPLSLVMLLLTGALDNISIVVRGTLMQVLTPDEMRGRVAAVNIVFVSSSNELGAFESGATAEWFGPVRAVVGGGVGTILIVLLVAAAWPKLARLGPLHALRPDKPAP